MLSNTSQVVRFITSTLNVSHAFVCESLDDSAGMAFQLHACEGFCNYPNFQAGQRINGYQAASMSILEQDEVIFSETDHHYRDLVSQFTYGLQVNCGISIPIQGRNGHWGMLAVYSDALKAFTPKEISFVQAMSQVITTIVEKLSTPTLVSDQSRNIERAKKHWELAIDSLPQLVIGINHDVQVIRVNRTIETWGMGNVKIAKGLDIADFLAPITHSIPPDSWAGDWTYIWQRIENKDMLEWTVDQPHSGRTFQFTLRKVIDNADHVNEDERCYAVLVIDDISTRQSIENYLKEHAMALRSKVNKRTLELKQANEQLEYELQAQKLAEKELKESRECRLELLREIISAQETERKRIACELHDSIGQILGATKFKVEELLIDKEQTLGNQDYAEFKTVVDKLQEVIQEVRHIAMDLRPAMLDDLGVTATLQWFCREFESTYKKISIHQNFYIEDDEISDDKRIVIFRIVQEAMNNISKYANASEINLDLVKTDAGIKLSISDNGKGFDIDRLTMNRMNIKTGSSRCGIGMSSMRERAEASRGTFYVDSEVSKGTCISVLWLDDGKTWTEPDHEDSTTFYPQIQVDEIAM